MNVENNKTFNLEKRQKKLSSCATPPAFEMNFHRCVLMMVNLNTYAGISSSQNQKHIKMSWNQIMDNRKK